MRCPAPHSMQALRLEIKACVRDASESNLQAKGDLCMLEPIQLEFAEWCSATEMNVVQKCLYIGHSLDGILWSYD